jgi:transglutaminase-like putative cysteine protease
MRLLVEHSTIYRYEDAPRRVIQLLRLTPASFTGQTVLDWRVDVDCDASLREGRDGYGNVTHMLYVDRPVHRLSLSVSGRVLTEDKAGLVRGLAADLPPEVFLRPTALTQAGEALEWLAATVCEEEGAGTLDILHRLNRAINGRMRFRPGSTGVSTGAAEAFAAGEGVCQDFVHIFIAAARGLGIPARYVSGHLFRRDGAQLQEAAHAWAEAWVEDLGWVAFDPANGVCTDDAYVRVACGLDYREASPVVGARIGGGAEALEVAVQVRQARGTAQSQTQS